jgi:hypothetical protein
MSVAANLLEQLRIDTGHQPYMVGSVGTLRSPVIFRINEQVNSAGPVGHESGFRCPSALQLSAGCHAPIKSIVLVYSIAEVV